MLIEFKKENKLIIKDDENKKTGNRKGKISEFIFDPYQEEITELLNKGFSLEKILKEIKIGVYGVLHYYIENKNLKEETKE